MMAKKDHPEPYIPRVAEKMIRRPPGIWIVDVVHAENCDHWRGRTCNCDPELGEPTRVIDPGSDPTLH